MIETDLAEFVDHHRRVRHRRIAQRAVEQRGLAAAQEAGEDGDGGMGQGFHLLTPACVVYLHAPYMCMRPRLHLKMRSRRSGTKAARTPRNPAGRMRSGGRTGSW